MSQPQAIIAAPEEVTISGRVFTHAARAVTFEQDIYLMRQVRAAKLDNVSELLGKDRGLEEISTEILMRVFESDHTFELLAGYLLEKGREWSPTAAAENARFFASRTDLADKEVLRSALVALVLAFFMNGVARTKTSLRSLAGNCNSGDDRGAAPESTGTAAAPSTSASMTASSASSRDTTSRGSRKSSAGRSAKG